MMGKRQAIIRHQDIGEKGKITTLGQLIQLATIFGESTLCRTRDTTFRSCMVATMLTSKDNMGGHADFVHKGTIEDVTTHFPRQKWSSCFAATIREENGLKPWAHTTALGDDEFPEGVLHNKLMAPYDD